MHVQVLSRHDGIQAMARKLFSQGKVRCEQSVVAASNLVIFAINLWSREVCSASYYLCPFYNDEWLLSWLFNDGV